MKSLHTPNGQLAASLLIGAAVAAAFLVGGDPGAALISGGLVITVAVAVHVGRHRSQTIEIMGGIGDERTSALYRDACAFSGTVMSLVLPAWWLVTVAQGDPSPTLAVLCAIFGLTWVAAVAVFARRS